MPDIIQPIAGDIPQHGGLPRQQITKGKSIFGKMGMDVSHFSAIWHIYKIAQLMETDLNRISRQNGLSIADFHLLGAIMMEEPHPLMAAKLALVLNVSSAALSMRVNRLSASAMLVRDEVLHDRRAKYLRLTELGRETVKVIGFDLQNSGRFAHFHHKLPQGDREKLDEILAHLHTMLDRDFSPVTR